MKTEFRIFFYRISEYQVKICDAFGRKPDYCLAKTMDVASLNIRWNDLSIRTLFANMFFPRVPVRFEIVKGCYFILKKGKCGPTCNVR